MESETINYLRLRIDEIVTKPIKQEIEDLVQQNEWNQLNKNLDKFVST